MILYFVIFAHYRQLPSGVRTSVLTLYSVISGTSEDACASLWDILSYFLTTPTPLVWRGSYFRARQEFLILYFVIFAHYRQLPSGVRTSVLTPLFGHFWHKRGRLRQLMGYCWLFFNHPYPPCPYYYPQIFISKKGSKRHKKSIMECRFVTKNPVKHGKSSTLLCHTGS